VTGGSARPFVDPAVMFSLSSQSVVLYMEFVRVYPAE
jgi:hypothetical protein